MMEFHGNEPYDMYVGISLKLGSLLITLSLSIKIVMKYYIIIILFSIMIETLTTTISTSKRIEGAIILDHTQVHETHSHHGKRKFLHG